MFKSFSAIAAACALTITAGVEAQAPPAFATAAHRSGTSPGIGIFQVANERMGYKVLTGLITQDLKAQRYEPEVDKGPALNIKPAVMPLDEGNLYYSFVAPASEDLSTSLFGSGDQSGRLMIGSMLNPGSGLRSGQWMVKGLQVLPTTPSIGGAILPDNPVTPSLYQANVLLLAYPTTDKQLHLDAWWVPQNAYAPVGQTLATFTPFETWDGNISVALRREASPESTSTTPYGVYLANRIGISIYIGYAPMGNLEAGKTNPAPVFKWQMLVPPDGISSPTATVQVGTDNRVMVYYLNGQGQLGSILIGGTASRPTFTQQAAIALPTASTGSPSVSFAIGDAQPWPDPNTGLKGIKVPVYRHIFYTDRQASPSISFLPAAKIAQYAWAQRDVLPGIAAKQQTLVGIIEGPPPIPGENIAVTGPGNLDTIGFTRYGVQGTQKSGSYVSTRTGELMRITTEGGQAGGVDSEIDMKREKQEALESSTSTTSLASFTARAKTALNQTTSKDEVIGQGQAFVLGATYTGYRYHFLDPNNQPIPGAREYVQVFATSPQVRAYPFDLLDGGPYPVPGKLMSYVVPEAEFTLMKSSQSAMLGFKTPTNSGFGIYYGWTQTGGYGELASALDSKTQTSTATFDLSAMLGLGLHGDIQSWSMMGGGSLSTTVETSFSKDDETSISSEADFPVPPNGTLGVYTRYGYHTVPFKGSAWHATELVDYLQRTKASSQPNRELLQALVLDPANPLPPLGEPWKVAYYIEANDYLPLDFNDPQAMISSAAAEAVSLPPPPQTLSEAGITSANEAGMLLIAVRELKEPWRVKPNTPDLLPQRIRELASRLSPEQMKQLGDYTDAIHIAKVNEFKKLHPNWRPRELPSAHPMQTGPQMAQHATGKPEPKQVDFKALAERGDMLKADPVTARTP